MNVLISGSDINASIVQPPHEQETPSGKPKLFQRAMAPRRCVETGMEAIKSNSSPSVHRKDVGRTQEAVTCVSQNNGTHEERRLTEQSLKSRRNNPEIVKSKSHFGFGLWHIVTGGGLVVLHTCQLQVVGVGTRLRS